MKILCAVDFSESSAVAARAAARLAGALDAGLLVVHAQHLPVLALRPDPRAIAAEAERRRAMLAVLAGELGVLAGRSVDTELSEGLPDEVVLSTAERVGADVILVGPVGDRPHAEWNLGSVAMRVIKGALVPVLVVREEESFARWLRERDPLRVLVGCDPHGDRMPPLEFLDLLRRAGPLEVSAGHVYLPGEERTHAASSEHELALAAEILERLSLAGVQRARAVPGFGRVAEHLLDLAAAEASDLVVVGSHHRHGWNRLVHGSVSLDIVASARRNALVVPLVARAKRLPPAELNRVLVPVDFSALSPLAIEWALRILPVGGSLLLVHVRAPYISAAVELGAWAPLPPPSAEELARDSAELARRLRELVPTSARERGIEVEVEELSGFDPATQIVSAVERLRADLVCMPTHGRSGLSRALMGSVAQGVLRRSKVPVLVVPAAERSTR